MAHEQEPPDTTVMDLGAVLSALADPNRRRVIHDLANSDDDAPRPCSSFGLPVSKSTLSHHFKVLRESGLIRQEDRGNMSGVTLRRRDIDDRFPGLLSIVGAEPLP